MPAVRETDAVLPPFSDDKLVEHQATQDSPFNLTNITCRIHRSSASTGQKDATGHSDKAKAEDTKLLPLKSQKLLKDISYYFIVTFPRKYLFPVYLIVLALPLLVWVLVKIIILLSIKEKLFLMEAFTCLWIIKSKYSQQMLRPPQTTAVEKTGISFYSCSHHNTWNDLAQSFLTSCIP